MNENGFSDPYTAGKPSRVSRWSATHSRYWRIDSVFIPGRPSPHRSRPNCSSASTASFSMSVTCCSRASSKRSGSSLRTVSTTSNAKFMCIVSSRKTQLVPVARPCSSPRERNQYTYAKAP